MANTEIGATSAVGIFPTGASPYGLFGFSGRFRAVGAGLVPALGDHKGSPLHVVVCTENPREPLFDMSGNVWDWCSTIWDEKAYPFKVQDGWTEDYLRTNVPRVLGGGAFGSRGRDVRCAVRHWANPNYGDDDLDFRVVLPPK